MYKILPSLFLTFSIFNAIAQNETDLHPDYFDSTFELEFQEELNQRNKISLRNEFKLDSSYLYEGSLSFLTSKQIYFDYNSVGNYANSEIYSYDDMNWAADQVISQEFYDDGKVKIFLRQKYVAGVLENLRKAEYFYDSNGNEILVIVSSPVGQGWEQDTRYEYEYDENNQIIISKLHYNYQQNSFHQLNENIFTIENGLTTEAIRKQFMLGELTSTEKGFYTYDSNNEFAAYHSFKVLDNGDLEADGRTVATHPDALTTVRTSENFDNGSWDPFWKFVITEFDDIPEWQYLDHYLSPSNSSEFEFNYRREYFYSYNPLNSEVPNNNNLTLKIANPFSNGEQIIIDGIIFGTPTTFSLIDMSGKLILQKQFSQDIYFNIDAPMPNGMYLMSLSQNNEVVLTKKVVKIK